MAVGKKRSLPSLAGLLLVLIAALAPRLAGLDRFVTPDEHLWLSRSANFYSALRRFDLASTYQKGHPGVTIMWAGAASFYLHHPGYFLDGDAQENPNEFARHLRRVGAYPPLDVLVTARAFLAVAAAAAIGLGFLYARRLFGAPAALVGFLFVALDPFYIGLTRLLHLDGLLASLMVLSLLALVAYRQGGSRLDLLVSGLAAGLSWLTKVPGGVLVPLALAVLWLALPRRQSSSQEQAGWFRVVALPWILWVCIGLLVFVALWPAMWVHPVETVTRMLAEGSTYAEEGHQSRIFFDGQVTQGAAMPFLQSLYFYPVTILWRITPLVLLGLLFLFGAAVTRSGPLVSAASRWSLVILLLAGLVFTALMALSSKKFDRYLLPVYPLLDLAAGVGWVWLAQLAANKLSQVSPSANARFLVAAGMVGLLAYQAAAILAVFPYYLTYYNPLLGGSAKALDVLQVGWGEGLDQAARYLNRIPGAASLDVLSWYAEGSFSYFFAGQAADLNFADPLSAADWRQVRSSDYLVIYIHQWQREIPLDLLSRLSGLEPVYSVWLDGIEYVRIYDLSGVEIGLSSATGQLGRASISNPSCWP